MGSGRFQIYREPAISIENITLGSVKLEDADTTTKAWVKLDSTANALYVQSESMAQEATLQDIRDTSGIKKITDNVKSNLYDGLGTALTSTLVGADQALDVNVVSPISVGSVKLEDADSATKADIELDTAKNALFVQSESMASEATLILIKDTDGIKKIADDVNVRTQDGAGTDITSTLNLTTKQSLDVNITGDESNTTKSVKLEDGDSTTKLDIELDSTKNAAFVQSETLATDATLSLIKDTDGIKKIADPVTVNNRDGAGNDLTSTLNLTTKQSLDVNITGDETNLVKTMKIEDGDSTTKLDVELDSLKNAAFVQSESLASETTLNTLNTNVAKETTLTSIKDTDGIKKITDPVTVNNRDGAGNSLTSTNVSGKQSLDVNITQLQPTDLGTISIKDATTATELNVEVDSTKNAAYVQSESLASETTLGLIKDTDGIKKITDPVTVNIRDGAGTALTSTLIGSDQALDVNIVGENVTRKSNTTLFSSTTLTATYVNSSSVDCSTYNQAILNIAYTKGDETSFDWYIQFSPDNSNWFDQTWEVLKTAVPTEPETKYNKYTATISHRIAVPIADMYIRVRVKATGGTPTGTITMVLTLSEI